MNLVASSRRFPLCSAWIIFLYNKYSLCLKLFQQILSAGLSGLVNCGWFSQTCSRPWNQPLMEYSLVTSLKYLPSSLWSTVGHLTLVHWIGFCPFLCYGLTARCQFTMFNLSSWDQLLWPTLPLGKMFVYSWTSPILESAALEFPASVICWRSARR